MIVQLQLAVFIASLAVQGQQSVRDGGAHSNWSPSVSSLWLSGAGDVDQDGYADLLFALPEGNEVRVLSGVDGSVLERWSFDSTDADRKRALLLLGDRDGDGNIEFALGVVGRRSGEAGSPGRISVFEHGSKEPIAEFEARFRLPDATLRSAVGPPPTSRPSYAVDVAFGGSIAQLEDRDGDGVRELLVSSQAGWHGSAYVLSGLTLSLRSSVVVT